MIYPEVLFTVVFAQIKPAVSSSRIRILLPNYFEPSIAPGEAVFQHHRLRGFHRETDGGIGRNVVTGLADQKFKRQFRRIGDFITPFGRTNRMPCKARLDELREQIGASDQYTIKIGQRPARFDCFAHPSESMFAAEKNCHRPQAPPHTVAVDDRRSAGGCRNWTYRPLRVR